MVSSKKPVSVEMLPELLKGDDVVKLAGVDIDGMLRGKVVSKKKFLSIAKEGFGFCGVMYGWDMVDTIYTKELKASNRENGYRDIIAVPDLKTFRRIPWEDNIPVFLVHFYDPDTKERHCADPRSVLNTVLGKLEAKGYNAMAGIELEFMNFKTPSGESPAAFLRDNAPQALPPMTEGLFGYSITRPVLNKEYYYDILKSCAQFDCDVEGLHTECGPGVYEAALEFNQISEIADRATMFKYAIKSIANKYAITPCFMAKPKHGVNGCSGHTHISVVDRNGKNMLAREQPDKNAQWSDIAGLSDMGRHFLAGILHGLPDILAILAPTVNSYKRLVANHWAPITVSWGLENRSASVRVISPPTSKPDATRFEVRVPGADVNPSLVMAAILAIGWRGVEKKLDIPIPPIGKGQEVGGTHDQGARLSRTLSDSTERFMAKGSIAREVFGDDFVDHFGGTREHEVKVWNEAVTDWEVKRYIETV